MSNGALCHCCASIKGDDLTPKRGKAVLRGENKKIAGKTGVV